MSRKERFKYICKKVFVLPPLTTVLIALATYTFYITIAAIINVVKFRKKNSPVLSASKVIALTAALVSMLSLETAMLAEFGGDDVRFRRIMTGVSGGVVCVLVLGMAIYMIGKATKYLRQSDFE